MMEGWGKEGGHGGKGGRGGRKGEGGRGEGEGGRGGKWKMAGNLKKGTDKRAGKFETSRMRVLVSPSIGG